MQVVCRQLGFPFGTVMDVDEVRQDYNFRSYDYSDDVPIWATDVRSSDHPVLFSYRHYIS